MSIKSNKLTICEGKTRKNKKITLIIEEDTIEWCFPEPLWEHIKDFVGIFDKVNRIDKPFLRNISLAIEYETASRFIQKYLNHMSWDPEQANWSKILVAGGHLVENYNLSNKKLTKQIYNRCLKDPSYCRLQACKWNQELPPRRKGVIYPTRFASFDLEDLWDVSFCNYNKDSIYAPQYGPIITKSRQSERERYIKTNELIKRQEAAKSAADKWMGGRMRVSIAEMKTIIQKEEEEKAEAEEEQKFYLSSGWITKSFYHRYIKDEVSKATQKKFEALLINEEEDFIEYDRCGISNPDDSVVEFSSLWFFDINLDSGYMPVFIAGINTSSRLAMELCGMDRDDREDEELTLEQMLEKAPNGSQQSKEAIKKILLKKKGKK
jgi:hypothetical protein